MVEEKRRNHGERAERLLWTRPDVCSGPCGGAAFCRTMRVGTELVLVIMLVRLVF